jgi:hypothetical protein
MLDTVLGYSNQIMYKQMWSYLHDAYSLIRETEDKRNNCIHTLVQGGHDLGKLRYETRNPCSPGILPTQNS